MRMAEHAALAHVRAAEAECEAAHAAWGEAVGGSIALVGGDLARGEVTVRHWAVALLASSFQASLDGAGAPNCLEFRFQTAEGRRIVATLQRCEGKSPLELCSEAEERAGKLRAALEAIRAEPRRRGHGLALARIAGRVRAAFAEDDAKTKEAP